jgi:hypothetical protein
MGRMLKNTEFKTGSYALGLPVGSSTVGPDSPVAGQTRWNTTTTSMEYYTGTVWNAVAHEGNVSIVKDTFTGDDSTSSFGPMSYSYASSQEPQVLVFLNTVYQNPGVNYTFNGTSNIIFTSTPTANAAIIVLHNISSTTAA